MNRHTELKATLKSVDRLIESLRPEAIRNVGPQMLSEMAAYHTSPKFFRRRRAECLHSAVWFRLLSIETGKDRSKAILNCLADCRKWRQAEKASAIKTPAPAVRKAA